MESVYGDRPDSVLEIPEDTSSSRTCSQESITGSQSTGLVNGEKNGEDRKAKKPESDLSSTSGIGSEKDDSDENTIQS